MNNRFDYTVLDMINNAIRTVKASPLILGSTASGSGGPPGGIVGWLPQARVAYDTVESGTMDTPASGMSLVDNLNHIRARLSVVESGGGGASSFLDLTDTPGTYSGDAGKAIIVNPSETGLIFSTISGGGGSTGVDVYSGGSSILIPASGIRFFGASVTASGSVAVVTIPSGFIPQTQYRFVLTDIDGLPTTNETVYWDPTLNNAYIGRSGGWGVLSEEANYHVLSLLAPEDNLPVVLRGKTWADDAHTSAYLQQRGYRSGGTRASPSAVGSGYKFVGMQGFGYDGTSYGNPGGASNGLVVVKATEVFSGSGHGAAVFFEGTPNASTTREEFGKVTATGFDLPSGRNYRVNGASIIEDAINNGVTDKAPSENAVFDALALKANNILTGLSLATSIIVADTDTVLVGIGKLEAQAAFTRKINGFAIANDGTDPTNDISIGAGTCWDLAGTQFIKGAASIKQLDAAWAVGTGAGMRASGAAIANTTYHIFAIMRPDTGVVDYAADTSVTGANIAANTNAAYTVVRRIFSIVRLANAIKLFIHDGDKVSWQTPVADVNAAASIGTSAVTRTLTLPTGLRIEAFGDHSNNVDGNVGTVITDLSCADIDPATNANVNLFTSGGAVVTHALFATMTNTSAQVRTRHSASGAAKYYYLTTYGYKDRRDQD